MLIHAGYEITYDCPAPSPMLLMLTVHPSRHGDLEAPDVIRTDRDVPLTHYRDGFGNICTRVLAPAGLVTFSGDITVRDSGEPDPVSPNASLAPVQDLPDEVVVYLLGSRYCETDRMSDLAWSLFGGSRGSGWALVQDIVDYVHTRIAFGYQHARATKTAWEAHEERRGVCRDYAHLAITLCRCMNIPARYCTGYLGDIGIDPIPGPMDFSAWFEVYLDGAWRTFDARHNRPRIGRILIAHGRDATDTAITTTFGAAKLVGFKVITDELDLQNSD